MQNTQLNNGSSFLKVRIDQILSSGLIVEEELSADFMTSLLKDTNNEFVWTSFKNAQVSFEFKPETESFLLLGTGTLYLNCACTRCLKDVPFQISLNINLRLFEKKNINVETTVDMELFESDSALQDQDLTTAYYENRTIDLANLLREQLFLDLPMYPTCDHSFSLAEPKVCDFYSKRKLEKVDFAKKPFSQLADWHKQLPEN